MRCNKIHVFQFATSMACARYRFMVPGKALVDSGRFKVTMFSRLSRQILTDIVKTADLLILQRMPSSPGVRILIDIMKQLNRPVIFEIDDDLLGLPENSWQLRTAPVNYKQRLKSTLVSCQAVQCSTPALAQKLRPIHDDVVVLDNQLPHAYPIQPEPSTESAVVVGYAAGENHLDDWLVIRDVFNHTIESYEQTGAAVEVRIIGDKRIFDMVATEQKRFMPVLGYADYMAALGEFDISLMPLRDNSFNRAKSDVKFLESAAAGPAVLASHLVYHHSVTDDETGILFQTPEQFKAGLLSLLQSRDLRSRLSTEAREYINLSRTIACHVNTWRRTYERWLRNGRGEI